MFEEDGTGGMLDVESLRKTDVFFYQFSGTLQKGSTYFFGMI